MSTTREKARRAGHYIYNVPLPKTPKKPRKRRPGKIPAFLTEDERERLFKAVRAGKSARDIALFSLMFFHGLRASEPGTLTYNDYVRGPALGMDRLFIRRKKGSLCGEVTLIAACAQTLRAWIRQRGSRPGPLFVTRQGTGISRSRVFALMVRYGKAAGLAPAKLHPHCLKHACAIDLANYKKEPILDIRAHLGHSSVSSTMRYIQMLDQAGEARARRLADWK
jgi:integrase